MTEQPETVYKAVIATMEERGGKIEKRDDKELYLIGTKPEGGDRMET